VACCADIATSGAKHATPNARDLAEINDFIDILVSILAKQRQCATE
jgi:hypothetical protein